MPARASLIPRQAVPELSFETLAGTPWSLSDGTPENFTLVVVYRGLHCPVCRRYLKDLTSKLDDFSDRGVDVVAVSSDGRERAARAVDEWKLGDLEVGFGLTLEQAGAWGLFVSRGRGETSVDIEEPPLFVEPGIFLVRTDGTLYFSSVQTMPFARPTFGEIVPALDFVLKNDYPARGEVSDAELEPLRSGAA